jgi:methylated-DNA-[protein]-cysteine S-methyltransferase
MYYSTTYSSPIGTLTLACHEDSLAGLWIEGQKYWGATLPQSVEVSDNRVVFEDTKAWLDQYFAGHQPDPLVLPLAPAGSEFRQGVWKILCTIPYGSVMTYAEIATQMAATMGKEYMSSQAVGGAVGHNPISIIIPCHRVVGSNGSLTGYASGVHRKQWLLHWEGVDLAGVARPA